MNRTELDALKAKIVTLKQTEKDWQDIDKVKAQYDALGKLVQTAQGTGTAFDPYKTWKTGMKVNAGEWWQTDDGYLWEAKKTGVPGSSTDGEYWDMPE